MIAILSGLIGLVIGGWIVERITKIKSDPDTVARQNWDFSEFGVDSKTCPHCGGSPVPNEGFENQCPYCDQWY